MEKKDICGYCKRNDAVGWINSVHSCTICISLSKYDSVQIFVNKLKKHRVWDKFVELYPDARVGGLNINKQYIEDVLDFHKLKYG